MTTEQGIEKWRGNALTPQEFTQEIVSGHAKAKTLRNIVESRGLAQMFGKGDQQSEHLRVEGWQILGMAYGVSCRTEIADIIRDKDYVAVRAKAYLLTRDGVEIGGAESICDNQEEGHRNQSTAQIAGMAQTRAESRAYKENLSWVAELAGYAPTPAEEMMGIKNGTASDSMMCPVHKVRWFKSGRMREYAHPVDGATGPKGGKVWCNMEEVLAQAAPAPQNQPSEAPDPAGTPEQVEEAVSVAASGPPARDMPASVGELLTRATTELGFKNRAEVFRVLGIESAIEIANPKMLAASWEKLLESGA